MAEGGVLPHPPVGPRPATSALVLGVAPKAMIFDGGPATCAALDELALDAFVRQHGAGWEDAARLSGPRDTFLDADWVATDAALLYVIPRARFWMGFAWAETTAAAGRRKQGSVDVVVTSERHGTFTFTMASTAAANLLAIAQLLGHQ